jgi:hypothetical protein
MLRKNHPHKEQVQRLIPINPSLGGGHCRGASPATHAGRGGGRH